MATTLATSLYDACTPLGDGENFRFDEMTLLCISRHFTMIETIDKEHTNSTNQWFLVFASSLIFFMQAGFAMVCAGCVRKKNLQNTMLKNILDASFAALVYFAIGYAFAFGGQNKTDGLTFVGTSGFFGVEEDIDYAFWAMELTFSATCVTIVAGTVAERLKMGGYLLYTIFLSGFVYPVAAHSLWSSSGFLSTGAPNPLGGIGVIDFAGSGAVHLLGGTAALCAAWVLGPRVGRHGRMFRVAKDLPGHSVALQLLGTMILWFCWFGFNSGSALLLGLEHSGAIAARAAANTSLAGSLGALSAMFTHLYVQFEITGEIYFNIGMAMNGALSGLVAITSGCGTVELWAAALTGIIGGALYVGGHHLLVQLKIDDVVDGIPIHLGCGLWGMIATGLFSAPKPTLAAYGTDAHVGWFYSWGRQSSDATLLGNQILACLFLIGWTVATMLPFFLFLQSRDLLRLDNLNELVGLDQSYHGGVLQEAEEEVAKEVQEYERVDRKLKSSSKSGSRERLEPVGCVVEVTNESGEDDMMQFDDLNLSFRI